MPMPPDVQQVRALMGGVNYYRIFLPDLSKRLRPINALLRRGVMFHSRLLWRTGAGNLGGAHDPAGPRFPRLDAVADSSRPFHVYCEVCIDGFVAAFEQEQTGGSIKPIAYIHRATLDSERH